MFPPFIWFSKTSSKAELKCKTGRRISFCDQLVVSNQLVSSNLHFFRPVSHSWRVPIKFKIRTTLGSRKVRKLAIREGGCETWWGGVERGEACRKKIKWMLGRAMRKKHHFKSRHTEDECPKHNKHASTATFLNWSCRFQNQEVPQLGRVWAPSCRVAGRGLAGQGGTPTDLFGQKTIVNRKLQGTEQNCPKWQFESTKKRNAV